MSNAPTHSVHSAIATGPLLLLLFLLFGCLTPGAAFAFDGYDQLGFRTISDDCGPFFIGKYEAQDASVAYCMNQERPGPTKPGGPWLNFDQGWVWLDDEFAAIVCHGYPTATSFGGYHLSPDRARAATQLAVWMLNGTTHVDGTYSYTTAQGKTKSGHFTTDNEVVAAARWLHDSAKSGSIKAAPHRARRYLGAVSGGSKRQDMLYVLPAVSASFKKQSANAAITSGNNTYQFDGATFDIFESASGAHVGTIQMDSNGRAQATLLPNTAYYLVETKAPAGYVPRRDHIAFTTGNDGGQVAIDEQPGTINLHIVKLDAATNAGPQVGSSLAGAEFTCVSQSTPGWAQILTTDESGRATLVDVPLGTFTIYESKAPEGYLPSNDSWTYTVGADQLGDSGVVEIESRISDIPIAFDLEISKFKDYGNSDQSGLEQPAGGVRFQVISNTTGGVVGELVTNPYGFADTSADGSLWFGAGTRAPGVHGALPYDAAGYTIHEVESTVPAGFSHIGDWTISAQQMADGAKLQYIADNHALAARLQVVKRDASSGQVVALPGFAFQILDADGNPLTQESWYPNHVTLDRFVTDKSGCVTLPQSLIPGAYYIHEVAAQAPYLLRGEDVRIDVPADATLPPVVIASLSDEQTSGSAKLTKTSESGAPLAGAEFDVVVQQDVIALRHQADKRVPQLRRFRLRARRAAEKAHMRDRRGLHLPVDGGKLFSMHRA